LIGLIRRVASGGREFAGLPLSCIGRDKGRYAVNASGNWRITFGWKDGDAIDVDLEDYH
jgi:hypothetical protein